MIKMIFVLNEEMSQKVNNSNNKNKNLVYGCWPQTKTHIPGEKFLFQNIYVGSAPGTNPIKNSGVDFDWKQPIKLVT